MGNYRAETEKTGPRQQVPENALEEGLNELEEIENQKQLILERTRRQRRARRIRKMRLCFGTTFTLVLLGTLVSACMFRNPTVFSYPLHASCNITWIFSSECNPVANKVVQQIDLWKTNETCGSGQKCLYTLVKVDKNVITATHTTPVKHYIDDMTFTFYPNEKGCNVVGFSTSRTWYAILDYGTNYCNLHNLIEGAGLTKEKMYSELTRDQVCTQYTSSNCEKY